MDVSGPYDETPRGNKYIVSFVDWLTNWPEAFAVPDKKAQTVAGLLLTEMIPRFGTPLELVSDNGPKNVNEIMRQSVNMKHTLTSPYHSQSNAKVEQFHRFLGDTLITICRRSAKQTIPLSVLARNQAKGFGLEIAALGRGG